MANVVGARPTEVAVMGTLTNNIHNLLASFYRPDRSGKGRRKIIIEGKAFPSDHVCPPPPILLLLLSVVVVLVQELLLTLWVRCSMRSSRRSAGTASTPPMRWLQSSPRPSAPC